MRTFVEAQGRNKKHKNSSQEFSPSYPQTSNPENLSSGSGTSRGAEEGVGHEARLLSTPVKVKLLYLQ